MEKNKTSILKNFMYNMVYELLILVLPLVTTPYLSRVLGAETIGIYTYTYAILSYFFLFGGLGMSLYASREIAYVRDDKKKRNKLFWELAIFNFITISIASVIYYFAFATKGEYSLYYKLWMLELAASAINISWFFRGIEEFKKTVTRNVLVRIISVMLIFVFVKKPSDLALYILIYGIADLVGNIGLWMYLPKYLKGEKLGRLNVLHHLPYILLLFIPQIATQVWVILDKTMIGAMIADKAELGYYEQSQKLLNVIITVITSITTVMIPRIANTYAKGDKEQLRTYLQQSLNFVSLLAVPMMFGLIVISKEFVPIFFGPGYDKVITLNYIVSPVIYTMGIITVLGNQYLLLTGKQKQYTITILIGLVLNIILNYFMIKTIGTIGAAIASIITQILVIILQLKLIKKEFDVKEFFKLTIRYTFASVIMFGVCLFVGLFTSGSLSVILKILFGIVTYFIVLYIMKDEYFMMGVKRISSIFKSKLSRNS